MEILTIERALSSYLERFWVSGDTKSFGIAYIRLLMLFEKNLSSEVAGALQERLKQLRGLPFNISSIERLRIASQADLDRDLKDNSESTNEAMLNRLVFCSLLDTDETDSFYLTEPMFEFVRKMRVSPIELTAILEEEFVGFDIK